MIWILPCGHTIEIAPDRSFMEMVIYTKQNLCWECHFEGQISSEENSEDVV